VRSKFPFWSGVVLGCLVLCLPGAAPSQSTEPAILEGVVTALDGGQPLQGVAIHVDTRLSEPVATTDAAGRFRVEGIGPGAFRVFARREGMILAGTCEDNDDLPCADVWLPGGETVTLDLQMRRTASISGRVVDPDGVPVAGVFVGLQVYDYVSRMPGQRILRAFGPPGEAGRTDVSNCRFALAFEFGADDPDNVTRCEERALAAGLGRAITNEAGEWRLSGLTPGEYFVVVAPDRRTFEAGEWRLSGLTPGGYFVVVAPDRMTLEGCCGHTGDTAQSDEWFPVYYPGTPDPDLAEPVRVTSPAEYTGIEIGWDRFTPVRIAGSVIGLPDSAETDPFLTSFEKRVGPFDVTLHVETPDGQVAPTLGASTARSGTTGTFEVEVLPFHEYVVTAQMGNRYAGRVRVSVGDSDVEDVTLPIALPLSVRGQFLFDPPVSREAMGEVSLRFSARYAEGSMSQTSDAGPDGAFEVVSLPGWDFLVEFQGLPEGYYVDTASFGRGDPLRDLFNPTGAPGSTLLIRAASASGRIIGTVTDARGEPREGALVTLVPEGNAAGRHDLYRRVEADADGQFVLETLRPGPYRVFAWESIPQYAERNTEFLNPYLSRGRLVTVGQNGLVDVELDLIPNAF
jgi:Carboxypeptidase regulatory-like domain